MKISSFVTFRLLAGISTAALLWLSTQASAQLKSKAKLEPPQKQILQDAAKSKTATKTEDGKLRLSNGVTVPEKSPDGKSAARMGNGWIRYSDGTLLVPEVDGGVVMKRKGKTIGRLQDSSSFDRADIWKPVRSGASESRSGASPNGTASSAQSSQAKPQIYDPSNGNIGASQSSPHSSGSNAPVNDTVTRPVNTSQRGGPSSATNAPSTDGGVQRTVNSTGEPMFTLSNGQQVPQSKYGVTGRPDGQGGVIYSDGTHITVDSNGNTVTTRSADRASAPSSTGESASQDGIVHARESVSERGVPTYTLSNGETVLRESGLHGVGRPDPKGGVVYDDGLYVYADGNGNTVMRLPDGRTGTYRSDGTETRNDLAKPKETFNANGEATYTLANGEQVPRFGPDGRAGTVDAKGQIHYSDGSGFYLDTEGQTQKIPPTGDGFGTGGPEGAKDFSGANPSSGGTKGSTSNSQPGSSGSTETSGSKDDKSSSSSQNDNSSTDDDNSSDSDDGDANSGSSDDSGDDADTGDDGSDGEDATKNMGAGTGVSGAQPDAKTTVDTVVAQKTGESRSPDSTKPDPCGDGSGGAPGSVSQPMSSSDQNCAPTTQYEGNDNSASRPVFTDPTRRPTGGVGGAIDPQGLEDQIREHGPDSLGEKLEDIGGVTNPG